MMNGPIYDSIIARASFRAREYLAGCTDDEKERLAEQVKTFGLGATVEELENAARVEAHVDFG